MGCLAKIAYNAEQLCEGREVVVLYLSLCSAAAICLNVEFSTLALLLQS
jgi:hypothetical protein